jgi:hypothetical protein
MWLANRFPVIKKDHVFTGISNSNKRKDEIIPESTVEQSNAAQALIPTTLTVS